MQSGAGVRLGGTLEASCAGRPHTPQYMHNLIPAATQGPRRSPPTRQTAPRHQHRPHRLATRVNPCTHTHTAASAHLPICAISTASPTWRMKVDLPPMLGPVIIWNQDCRREGGGGAPTLTPGLLAVGQSRALQCGARPRLRTQQEGSPCTYLQRRSNLLTHVHTLPCGPHPHAPMHASSCFLRHVSASSL